MYRHTSCINPVNFQVRMPNVKVTVRHKKNCGHCYNLQMARYSLNNSSIHLTYFLPTRQKAKTSFIHVPGRVDQETGWWTFQGHNLVWRQTSLQDFPTCSILVYINSCFSLILTGREKNNKIQKWPCYLENWESSDVYNRFVQFWSHLQLLHMYLKKKLTDAQNFPNLFFLT